MNPPRRKEWGRRRRGNGKSSTSSLTLTRSRLTSGVTVEQPNHASVSNVTRRSECRNRALESSSVDVRQGHSCTRETYVPGRLLAHFHVLRHVECRRARSSTSYSSWLSGGEHSNDRMRAKLLSRACYQHTNCHRASLRVPTAAAPVQAQAGTATPADNRGQ